MDTEEFAGEDFPSDWYYHDDVWCDCDECEPRNEVLNVVRRAGSAQETTIMDADSYQRMQWELAQTLEQLSWWKREAQRLAALLIAKEDQLERAKKKPKKATKRKAKKR